MPKGTIIYVLHHRNSGTPEANEIESVHATYDSAESAMAKILDSDYGVDEDEDADYMYISENILKK